MWVFGVMLVHTYLLYNTAHLIIWCKKKDEILSQYEFRKETALSWIQKNTSNVADNDNNNKRGRDDVKIASAGSSIISRGRKKVKGEKRAMRLNEKTLDPVGSELRCRLHISLCHLQDDNLNHSKKRSLLFFRL